MADKESKDWTTDILMDCLECGACMDDCVLLQEIGEEPARIAFRGVEIDEAYACCLCNLCEAVCPLDLSPGRMFAQKRIEAVAAGEKDVSELRYLLPDRELNILKFFRQYYDIDYTDLNLDAPAEIGFFPGCTMMSYSPELTRRVYDEIRKINDNTVFLSECCGMPLYQVGLKGRGDNNREHLIDRVNKLGLKTIVVVCPNCYYELRDSLREQDVELVTIYELLKTGGHTPTRNVSSEACTIHDSCPDRFDGIFANQVREALGNMGYQITEMEHSRANTICCGSGGQLSHSRPDFSAELFEKRMNEAKGTGSGLMVGYCHSCVLNYGREESDIKIRHALNLLLDFDEDYAGVKNKAGAMFEGPDGAENFEKIIAEPLGGY